MHYPDFELLFYTLAKKKRALCTTNLWIKVRYHNRDKPPDDKKKKKKGILNTLTF